MDKPTKPVKTIQSVQRAMDIIELVATSATGYKLGALAQACNLNKTTAFHLIKTLETRGYIEQSYDTQVYKAGRKLYELFSDVYSNIDVRPYALPYMEQLHDITDETVTLYYFTKYNDYYIGTCLLQVESSQSLKFSCNFGSRIPLHCTAGGKVRFLGYSEAMLNEQLDKMPFDLYTPHTTKDSTQLKEQLVNIRKQGYCIEKEEYLPGICSVSVPLFKYTGRVCYSLVVSIPSSRASDERLEKIATLMMQTLSSATVYPDFLFKGKNL